MPSDERRMVVVAALPVTGAEDPIGVEVVEGVVVGAGGLENT
jgi:hypothetical protein